MASSRPRSLSFVCSPPFVAASDALALLEPVAAALPPEWRHLAVHLRRAGTAVLVALALSAGSAGKQRRALARLARLRAFDLVGSLHAALAARAAPAPAVETAAIAYLRVVRLLAASAT